MRISVERIEVMMNRCEKMSHHCPVQWYEVRWLIKKIKRQERQLKFFRKVTKK